MAKFSRHFQKTRGEAGSFVIQESGLCLPGDAAAIEANCTKRYRLVVLPNADGVILKALDGTDPSVVTVAPLTDGQSYQCVKVHGETQPYAPPDAGAWCGSDGVLAYVETYQQVGGVV